MPDHWRVFCRGTSDTRHSASGEVTVPVDELAKCFYAKLPSEFKSNLYHNRVRTLRRGLLWGTGPG
jgi:hypothetical protein